MEIWKDVVGYEKLYKVSSKGRMLSLPRVAYSDKGYYFKVKGKTLKITWTTNYPQISLSKTKKQKNHLIHRLVAQAFIPNPLNKRTVNHKNGIKSDNRVENLEWFTYLENNHHAIRTGLTPNMKGEKNPSVKLTKDKVLEIRKLKSFFTQKELGLIFNISQAHISCIISRNNWGHI